MFKFILATGLLFSGSAFAEGAFSSQQLLEATKIALADFTAERPALAPSITGFKTWKSGDAGKVKIYVTERGQNQSFTYSCHGHDGLFECHGQ